jgi:hypothetical protein
MRRLARPGRNPATLCRIVLSPWNDKKFKYYKIAIFLAKSGNPVNAGFCFTSYLTEIKCFNIAKFTTGTAVALLGNERRATRPGHDANNP